MRLRALAKSAIFCLALISSLQPARPATVSPLFARGYTVLPTPQRVKLRSQDFEFTAAWRIQFSTGLNTGDANIAELNNLLRERFHISLNGGNAGVVELAIAPNTVFPTATPDKNTSALARQAYRLSLAPGRIAITGNSAVGLYYGVETLIQLLKEQNGKLWLPEAEIEDWPDLELRIIYWDDAHHLEHLDVLKRAIRQASFYKINGFAIKLEGHFQYDHAKPIVEPYALSPGQFQELTDYGLDHHVQVIPYLDGPAHDAFILKHPEYSSLREYPDSNYEFCATNPDTYKLFEGMFADLLAANKGGKYFVLSTDEAYYAGLAHNAQCDEAGRARELGSPGKLLAEFIMKTAKYLHDHGRTVIFWGEYPLKPEDIGALPGYLVNGEVYGPQFDPVFRAHGIRQMIYTSTEGEEPMFPQYSVLPQSERLHAGERASGRVQAMLESISLTSQANLSSMRPESARPNQADLIGAFVAGWADAGLHPETFWLGYATGPAAAWHSGTSAPELSNSFYALFYGPSAVNMGRVYQLMSEGAQFWEDSWETGPSAARKPIWGDSHGPFNPPRPATDQFLPPLGVPEPEALRINLDWRKENARRLELADRFLARNTELLDLLLMNMRAVSFNRYNLEVFISIANLYRQNLTMLQSLGEISNALQAAEGSAAKAQPKQAVESLDRALDLSEAILHDRNRVLRDATETWYKSWLPRVPVANGRTFLHEVDDVKDHEPVRTVDMGYLVYREVLYPLGDWASKVVSVRNRYAQAHSLPSRPFQLDWERTTM